ncbi:unnamed protein product [Prunus armeniaca]|uniref:Reverse transcriptase zinc-binding domain-containing protein n=1 Tax=Prunus armeniaca TaxID=36596 RepID=A0A6J5V931_PRUAR|nr:unnamed protein product [Prunus armeniaca]
MALIFWGASCGRGSSWGWKGIIQGRKVLEAGLRWRIGNGKIVRISEDGWLPKPYAFKVLSRHPDMPHRVMDLIDPEVRIWQRDLIQRYFTLEEAQLILPMVISWWGCPDRQIWHFIKHGRYTVKSGYDLAIKLRRNGVISRKGEGECSNQSGQRCPWKRIWALQMPSKTWMFIWRCCRNVLVVHENFRRRHVYVEVDCRLCDVHGVEVEDFLSCWECLLQKFAHDEKMDEILQIMAFGLWRIWKGRNW